MSSAPSRQPNATQIGFDLHFLYDDPTTIDVGATALVGSHARVLAKALRDGSFLSSLLAGNASQAVFIVGQWVTQWTGSGGLNGYSADSTKT